MQAKEDQLAAIIAADPDVMGGTPGTCEVRLLRSTPEADFVMADCTATAPEDRVEESGLSFPLRVVDGDAIPGGGQDFESWTRETFPADLVDAVLENRSAVRP